MPKLLIIRGLPGSGKSTIAKALLGTQLYQRWVEADMFFTDQFGNYKYEKEKLPEAHNWCFNETFKYLADGYDTIVANVFSADWQYIPYIREAIDRKYPIQMILLCSDETFKSIHNVPEQTLIKMKRELDNDLSYGFGL